MKCQVLHTFVTVLNPEVCSLSQIWSLLEFGFWPGIEVSDTLRGSAYIRHCIV